MRKIDRSTTFRRDYRRESRGKYRSTLDAILLPVLVALQSDHILESRQRDHDLGGDWRGCRECHLKPDLLLIYCKPDGESLQLVRLGSHSELFG